MMNVFLSQRMILTSNKKINESRNTNLGPNFILKMMMVKDQINSSKISLSLPIISTKIVPNLVKILKLTT